MTIDPRAGTAPPVWWRLLTRKNVLSGLLFMAIAVLGLWLSRNYPVGTALRMGTGYVPRLLLWILLLLGVVVAVQGVRVAPEPTAEESNGWAALRPIVFVTASLVVFGLTIERLGLVIATVLMMAVGSIASRDLKPMETILTTVVLTVLSVVIFVIGLELAIPVWPEWQ
ncbi:MAG TPA: tripartite tricarboxylate transporter TctB family protein [Xanthobacteraceae bacterium]|nr:tripartite tricarboxylate transporter TctB family protein [Xanthobacteraceae bacterium]